MKLYVINLKRSPKRLARLQTVFSKMGLDFTRVDAVDGQELSASYCDAMTKEKKWEKPLTRGEVACFLSHKKALQKIADGDEEYAAIFEDDIVFSSDAKEFLLDRKWIPKSADIIKIETDGKKVWLGPRKKINNEHNIARLKSRHIMAAAYIISQQAAKKLVKKMDNVTAPFDHFLFNPDYGVFENFEMWQLDQAIAKQAGLKSTLEGARHQWEKKKKQNRKLSYTFKRETLRLFKRARTGIWGYSITLFTSDCWKRVKFKK
ncbi:glycosyltransferase family 25 protein [Bartonella tamiae]|uniref:Glycosyl transferase family 25 domain-containing protein n=1 Tax=Bartonella tamiae Th239 TaxID=1094558 RepID=J0QWB2_9HYPH|nr:glycosyltransferase family 25 protein [Bartonella tamiae]EJF90316.1 hypothetical protein ME5_00717 [Bartonella tamiae Th239]EJF93743.1 hypothetical protein MEG_01167 [Bartonella tamiae Th307]